MATVAQEPMTLQEFLKLPEQKPALEYIDGKAVQKVSPKAKHSRLQGFLYQRLAQMLPPAMEPFLELRCTFAGRSLVPDIAVLKQEQIPQDEAGEIANDITVAPHAVIEILSPDQRVAEIVEKIGFCLTHGVQWGCLIDPGGKRVMIFRPDDLPRQLSAEGAIEDEQLLPGFRLPVSELFGWLRLPEKSD